MVFGVARTRNCQKHFRARPRGPRMRPRASQAQPERARIRQTNASPLSLIHISEPTRLALI
eukprot:6788112-Alexandrium_andersonii.AAC.1